MCRVRTGTVDRSLGREKRGRDEQERERRGESMASSFPVNCILLSAEDSRKGICTGRGGNLSPISAAQLIISVWTLILSLYPFSLPAVLIAANDLK